MATVHAGPEVSCPERFVRERRTQRAWRTRQAAPVSRLRAHGCENRPPTAQEYVERFLRRPGG